MGATILRRVATAVPTVILGTILIFAMRFMLPGGPVQAMLGGADGEVSEEQVTAMTERMGLDGPIPLQYWHWITSVVQGDLGLSYYSQLPVTTVLSQRVMPSLQLILGSLVVAIIFGVTLGIWAAVRRSRPDGKLVQLGTGLGLAVPDFWLGTIAAGVLGLWLGVFPAVGFTAFDEDPVRNFHTLAMPVLVLSLTTGSFLARHVSSSMSAALDSPYVRTAWAMGLPPRTVYLNCALRNALGPVITFIPLAFASLVGGTVLVEQIFAIPGLGTEIIRSVTSQDYPVIQGIVLIVGVLVALLNLLADVLLSIIDPRIRKAAK